MWIHLLRHFASRRVNRGPTDMSHSAKWNNSRPLIHRHQHMQATEINMPYLCTQSEADNFSDISCSFSTRAFALKFSVIYECVFLTKYHSGDQVKNAEMGSACSTYGKRRGTNRVLLGKPQGRRSFGRPKRRREVKLSRHRPGRALGVPGG